MTTMTRKTAPSKTAKTKTCACGCGGIPKVGLFLPGHDAKLRSQELKKGKARHH